MSASRPFLREGTAFVAAEDQRIFVYCNYVTKNI